MLCFFYSRAEDDKQENHIKGAKAEIWVPSRSSPEQHWAVVQEKRPEPISWHLMGEKNRRRLLNSVRTAYFMQEDPLNEALLPWIISGRSAAILVNLEPVL